MCLNNDVATEILLRLPVQSLLRFRSVCKSWCNVIDSSSFRTLQLHSQSENSDGETLFLRFTEWGIHKLSILNADSGKLHKSFPAFQEFSNNFQRLSVTSPVNGLICVYNKVSYGNGRPTIGIYNPCLDKIKILPLSPICSSRADEWKRGDCRRVIGFGLDNATKHYKLVQLISFDHGHTCDVEVYSGTTNSWRKLNSNLLDDKLILFGISGIKSSAYTGSGSLFHWRAPTWTKRRGYNEYVILSFNMQSEVFETIPYPDLDGKEIDLDFCSVFAKDGYSFVLFLYTHGYRRLEVWELGSRENKDRHWTHVKNFNIASLTQGRRVSTALWNGDVVVMMEHDSFIFLNYITEEVIKRCNVPKINAKETFVFKGSLILP